jgi:hypothetical protein
VRMIPVWYSCTAQTDVGALYRGLKKDHSGGFDD